MLENEWKEYNKLMKEYCDEKHMPIIFMNNLFLILNFSSLYSGYFTAQKIYKVVKLI